MAGVGKSLVKAPSSVSTRESTQEKSLVIVANVEKFSAIALPYPSTRKDMLETSFPSASDLGTPSVKAAVSLSTGIITLERWPVSKCTQLEPFFCFTVKGLTHEKP